MLRAGDRRALVCGAVASLLLHAALLGVLVPPKQTPSRPSPVITARLAEPEPRLEVPAREAVRRVRPRPAAVPPVEPRREEQGIDRTWVERYRQELIFGALRNKGDLARAQGDVVVRIAVAASGANFSVSRSSGTPIVDEHALDMFRRAFAQLPVPAALRGYDFALEVQAIYGD